MPATNAHLFGWCSPGKDTYHAACRVSYLTSAGVRIYCTCPNHDHEETDDPASS